MPGFQNRIPDKIDVKDLHDGGFLLSEGARHEVAEALSKGLNGFHNVEYNKKDRPQKIFQVYLNSKKDPKEAFVLGPKLGEGAFGEVFLTQNISNGRWSCMKKLKDGKHMEVLGVDKDGNMEVLDKDGKSVKIKLDKDGKPIELDKDGKPIALDKKPVIYGKTKSAPDKYEKLKPKEASVLDKDGNPVVIQLDNEWSPVYAATELEILKQEGLFRSHANRPDGDVIISELIHGQGLNNLIHDNKQKKELSFEQSFALTISLAEAYESLQRKGYVHRDIKPGNVIVDMEQLKCVAVDFGLVSKEKSKHSRWSGTPLYLTQEALSASINGHYTPNFSDDIYALGITASEIFSSMSAPQKKTVIETSNVPSLSDRNAYAKQADALWDTINIEEEYDIGTSVNTMITPVLLGAEDSDYQQQENLSKEQISLYKLLFKMTGEKQNRPNLAVALQEMREIRFNHITKSLEAMQNSEYKTELEQILEIRNHSKSTLNPNTIDNMDAFMMRAIDSKEKNSLDNIKRYKEDLEENFQHKKNVNEEIKFFGQQSENLRKIISDIKKEHETLGDLLEILGPGTGDSVALSRQYTELGRELELLSRLTLIKTSDLEKLFQQYGHLSTLMEPFKNSKEAVSKAKDLSLMLQTEVKQSEEASFLNKETLKNKPQETTRNSCKQLTRLQQDGLTDKNQEEFQHHYRILTQAVNNVHLNSDLKKMAALALCDADTLVKNPKLIKIAMNNDYVKLESSLRKIEHLCNRKASGKSLGLAGEQQLMEALVNVSKLSDKKDPEILGIITDRLIVPKDIFEFIEKYANPEKGKKSWTAWLSLQAPDRVDQEKAIAKAFENIWKILEEKDLKEDSEESHQMVLQYNQPKAEKKPIPPEEPVLKKPNIEIKRGSKPNQPK